MSWDFNKLAVKLGPAADFIWRTVTCMTCKWPTAALPKRFVAQAYKPAVKSTSPDMAGGTTRQLSTSATTTRRIFFGATMGGTSLGLQYINRVHSAM